MKSYSLQLALLLAGVGVTNLVTIDTASAQSITPANDGTNTNIQQNGNTFNIGGGQLSSNQQNLFHSFQKFGLSQNEIANFLSNPNIQNILGRVTGGDASLINGLIQVTGGNSNLFLMNPAGIIFGNNASLNIPASFTATTATGIGFGNNLWFNATGGNNYSTLVGTPTNFVFNTTQPGSIINAGNLAVGSGANLTILAGTTVNTGTLTAPGGNITVAAVPGENLVRISQPGNVLSLDVVPPTANGTALPFTPLNLPTLLTGKTGVVNGLMVTADGKAVLTNSGKVVSDTAGSTTLASNINVSGVTGGNVNVLGKNVGLFGANINASGTNGGGTVLIGGDYKGQGTVFNAQNTTIDQNSVINANAVTSGNGGKVIAWADGKTIFDGNITAKGGAFSGNGGFVETSGKNILNIGNTAKVNTLAPQGNIGTWLLDPTDLTVVANGGTGTITTGNNSTADSTIDSSTIVTALNGTNVNLTADNSITVNAAIDASSNTNGGNLALTTPTTNLNEAIKLKTGSTLSGTATTVNVGANGTVQNGVDVATAGGKVNLAPATYTLSSTVNIGKDLTVTGAGANNTTVSGNNAVRVFNITGGNVTLDGLGIINGNAGNNDGGGISYSGTGTLNINNSIVSGNKSNFYGGGVSSTNNGKLTITNSTFSGNTVVNFGGGVFSTGLTTITNSTFSGNKTTDPGYAGGGAIMIEDFSGANPQGLQLINSTVSGNTSTGYGGGIRIWYGDSTIINSTITNNTADFNNTNSGNGGGIYNGGNSGGPISTLTVKNSIIAGNFDTPNNAGTGTINPDVSGTFTDSGNNLIGVSDGSTGFTVSTLVGTIASPIDPKLAPLADNGGSTQTHALLPGSPAIDAGDPNSTLTIDQRGGQRGSATNVGLNADTKIDIGAYEATSSYVVTNTKDDNSIGSLRSAINFANINVNPVTNNPEDTILFNIEGSGTQTISPTSALPDITKPVIIDGYSQTGATPNTLTNANNANLKIELNGAKAGAVNGLTLATGSDGSTIKGLAINGFSRAGIRVQSNNNNIQGNFIGTNIAGTSAKANGYSGVIINNGAKNNIIGTNSDGTNDLAEGNLISGNTESGVFITGTGTNDNIVAGNKIGTNLAGTSAIANKLRGVSISNGASSNIIGTDGDGTNDTNEGNLISGNSYDGVRITGTGTNDNIVAGNKIGTNLAGTSALANGNSGIRIVQGAKNNIIGTNGDGTSDANEGNLISGNIDDGVLITDTGTTGNIVAGNKIGTNLAGTSAIANGLSGVSISAGAKNNIIGTNGDGTSDVNEGNLISGNNQDGVWIEDTGTTGNIVAGNKIGTQANGTSALGNIQNGVFIETGASNNTIGGTKANTGNTIAFNAKGVVVKDNTSTGNQILGNSIFGNTGIGIDLNDNGITVNSTTNPNNTLPNGGQNYPLLLTASGTSIKGVINSAPSTTYRLEFFSSPSSDIDQGKTFLGTTNVTTDGNGIANFEATVTAIPQGEKVTATATNTTTGTSEFSATPGITISATAGTPQSTTVNQPFTTDLEATVKDTRGNPAANGVPITFTSPNNGSTAIFTGDTTVKTSNSKVTTSVKANTVAGSYKVTASGEGASNPAEFNLTNKADVPAKIAATGGTPQSTVVNTLFEDKLQVTVKDQFGNVVPDSTITFSAPDNTLILTNNGPLASGKFTGDVATITAKTNADGVAEVSIKANTVAGKFKATGKVSDLTPVEFNLTNLPDEPVTITATDGTSQSTIITTVFGEPLQVTVKDKFGNLVPNTTVTFRTPIIGPSGRFTGGVNTITTKTDSKGVAKVTIAANRFFGDFVATARIPDVSESAKFNLTNTLPRAVPNEFEPEIRIHGNRTFISFVLFRNFRFFSNFRPVAFLSSNDVILTKFNVFLPDIAAYMNSSGGILTVNLNDVMGEDYEGLVSNTENQTAIKRHLISLISQSVGVEYINLVNIEFKVVETKRVALIKIRKSPKPVKVKKDKKDKKEYVYVRQGDKTILLEGDDAKKFRKDD